VAQREIRRPRTSRREHHPGCRESEIDVPAREYDSAMDASRVDSCDSVVVSIAAAKFLSTVSLSGARFNHQMFKPVIAKRSGSSPPEKPGTSKPRPFRR